MRDYFTLLIAPVLVVLGAVVVYDGAVSLDPSQSMRVLGGAAMLALGFVQLCTIFKNWRRLRTRA